jgi:hypothetical protein
MPSPFTWDPTKPADTDYESVFPALDRQDKTNLSNVLGTLLPFGATTTGWRAVQVGNLLYLTINARYTGSQWVQDDPSMTSTSLTYNPSLPQMIFQWSAAGTSPFTTWQTMGTWGTATSGVNYLASVAQATGTAPALSVGGPDANISLDLVTKGSGILQLNGQALAQASVLANGYVRLGPITLQWGVANVTVATASAWTAATVTMPVPLSQAPFAVMVDLTGQPGLPAFVSSSAPTTTGFTVNVNVNGTGTYYVQWLAVGAS